MEGAKQAVIATRVSQARIVTEDSDVLIRARLAVAYPVGDSATVRDDPRRHDLRGRFLKISAPDRA